MEKIKGFTIRLSLLFLLSCFVHKRSFEDKISSSVINESPIESLFTKSINDYEKDEIESLLKILENKRLSPREYYWKGVLHLLKGDYQKALLSFVDSYVHSLDKNDPYHTGLKLISLASIGFKEIIQSYPLLWREKVKEIYKISSDIPLSPFVKPLLIELKKREVMMEGDIDEYNKLGAYNGCIRDFKIIGPIDLPPLGEMDEKVGPERGEVATLYFNNLPTEIKYGYIYEPIVRDGCTIRIHSWKKKGDFAISYFYVDKEQDVIMELNSYDIIKAYLDDMVIYQTDVYEPQPLNPVYIELKDLNKGWHKLLIRIFNETDLREFRVSLMDTQGNPIVRRSTTEDLEILKPYRGRFIYRDPLEGISTNYEKYKDSILIESFLRGYFNQPERGLLKLESSNLKDTIIGKLFKQRLLSDDYTLPHDYRYNTIINEAKSVLEKLPYLVPFVKIVLLQEIQRKNWNKAKRLVHDTLKYNPQAETLPILLGEVLFREGYYGIANNIIKVAEKINPNNLLLLNLAYSMAEQFDQKEKMKEIGLKIKALDFTTDKLLDYYKSVNDHEGLKNELSNLLIFYPDNYNYLYSKLTSAINDGDLEHAKEVIERILGFWRDEDEILNFIVDFFDNSNGIKNRLIYLRELFPLNKLSVERLKEFLERVSLPLEEWRVNSVELLREYEKYKNDYNTSSVMVLDRTITRIFDTGYSISLTHNIIHLKTEEAIDIHSEYQFKEGDTLLLKARTIKQDGTILEPQNYDSPIRFPNLAPGDFIEYEYLTLDEGDIPLKNGFSSNRFYFKVYDIALHRSQFIVIAPSNLKLQFDIRGDLPPPKIIKDNGIKVIKWEVSHSLPVFKEPFQPNSDEFLPSIRILVNGGWDNYRGILKELLIRKNIINQRVREQAQKILKQANVDTSDKDKVIETLYNWIVDNIDIDSVSIFEPGSYVLVNKKGSGLILLYSFLKSLGYNPVLGAVRSIYEDHSETEYADGNIYRYPIIKFNNRWYWLSKDSEYTTIDYIPSSFKGERVLIIDGEERLFDKILDYKPLNKIKITVLSYIKDKKLILKIKEELRGLPEIEWRKNLEGLVSREIKKRFEAEYLSYKFPGGKLKSLRIENEKKRELPLVLDYTVEWDSGVIEKGDNLFIKPPFTQKWGKIFASLGKRKMDLILPDDISIQLEWIFVVPDGYRSVDKRSEYRIEWKIPEEGKPSISFREERSLTKDDRLKVVREYILNQTRIKAKDYEGFAINCRKIDELESKEIELEKDFTKK